MKGRPPPRGAASLRVITDKGSADRSPKAKPAVTLHAPGETMDPGCPPGCQDAFMRESPGAVPMRGEEFRAFLRFGSLAAGPARLLPRPGASSVAYSRGKVESVAEKASTLTPPVDL